MDQLKTIFRALGTPTEDDWPVCMLVLGDMKMQLISRSRTGIYETARLCASGTIS